VSTRPSYIEVAPPPELRPYLDRLWVHRRRFTEHIGYGPKTLQRVLRFQRFMRTIASPRVELAGAAALAGYADQSHLSRETRRLAGLTPRQLRYWKH
jgi:methylphosphotriester-DNA--protein-cysteine methyltransferase